MIILLYLSITLDINAQTNNTNYSKQIEAFKQCFANKNSGELKAHLSAEYILPTATKEQTELGLNQLFSQLPLISMAIKESTKGKALITYNFEGLGERTSSIHFNDVGKITKVELFNNLIKESQERRNARPIPDELSKKHQAEKVSFTTTDSRTVVGNLYEIGNDKPIILLLHQLRNNKYEYADIAPKLNNMGFNVLAIDLTGGAAFADHENETVNKGTPISRADREVLVARAELEIVTAIDYLNKRYNSKVIVWGSSYSASMAIAVASANENVIAAISFSGLEKRLFSILSKLSKPVFMTSSKAEASMVEELLTDTPKENLIHFIPKGDGRHGSSALWNGQRDAEEYWVAIKSFLNKIKN